MASTMGTLIGNLYTIFDGQLDSATLSAESVWKGFYESPEMIPSTQFPYVSLEDGGERVEEVEANKTQNHFYTVLIEMGFYSYNREDSFNGILTLSDQVKTIIELEANKQLDSHVWGISIVPLAWLKEEREFYRARQVSIDFMQLEEKYFDF